MPTETSRPADSAAPPQWGFAASLAFGLALSFTPLVERIDALSLDGSFSALRRFAPQPLPEDIVLIGIDEAAERVIAEPLGLWHETLGVALSTVAAAKPRAIALDVVLLSRSANVLKPGLDQALLRGLADARRAAPLAIALALDENDHVRPLYPPFAEVAGEAALGLAVVTKDADGSVRRFVTEVPSSTRPVPTLVGRLCASLAIACRGGIIDYSRGEPYQYIPLVRVLAAAKTPDAALERELAGKVVFIATVLPFLDRARQSVPLAGWEDARDAPAVIAQAQALKSALNGHTIAAIAPWGTFLLVLAAALLWFVPRRRTGLVVAVGAGIALWAASTAMLRAGFWLPVTAASFTLVFAWGARAAREAWAGWRERERLRTMFAGYVSPEVMKGILSGEIAAGQKGERRAVAFVFADLRGFTALSEKAAPESVLALLNRHYAVVVEAVHRHDGTLDNFRGDGVMAIFGAPKVLGNPVAAAWAAIAELRMGLATLNMELEREGRPPLTIGVGLGFGDAVVGLMGATSRYDFTAIGDAANVAARLQDYAKTTGCVVVMSEAARARLGGVPDLIDLGELALAGHTPVRAWGVKA